MNKQKHGVLAVNTESQVNIGDYVQAMAPAQFFDSYDFIEREHLDSYQGDNVKMIMNGWYMHNPKNWPPSEKINPLFVSYHLNTLAKQDLLSKKSIAYFKKHEPIGCRDHFSAQLLKEKGVDAYFSGCMTLTLGQNYKSQEKEKKCYFVDAYYDEKISLTDVIKSFFCLIGSYDTLSKICINKYNLKNLKNLLKTAHFYSVYQKLFSDEVLTEAIFITQQSTDYNGFENQELIVQAEGLIKMYAKAAFVVTSRIHCALPCLAIETPVLYVEDKMQSSASSCRLNGLKQLFNILGCENNKLTPEFEHDINEKLSFDYIIKNKKSYLKYSEALISRCKDFLV
ncbi:polysaccharide pyruvyl transferase family protein [Flavobacteriaceae bacterium]|nr:polysaccharide pyruvyl transferase family protein [Flavobacteriaceae bacterium]